MWCVLRECGIYFIMSLQQSYQCVMYMKLRECVSYLQLREYVSAVKGMCQIRQVKYVKSNMSVELVFANVIRVQGLWHTFCHVGVAIFDMQCVAVCYSMLQRVAVSRNVLKYM